MATRTYEVRTYGCQMNVHDSERIAGLLDEAGYAPVTDSAQPAIVAFSTCAVRENTDNELDGNLGRLKPVKDRTRHATPRLLRRRSPILARDTPCPRQKRAFTNGPSSRASSAGGVRDGVTPALANHVVGSGDHASRHCEALED